MARCHATVQSRRPAQDTCDCLATFSNAAQQGADTITWRATADPELLGSGGFWHGRRRRPGHLLPCAREDASAGPAAVGAVRPDGGDHPGLS